MVIAAEQDNQSLDTLEAIDHRINELKRELCMLAVRRNFLIAINRLPTETLNHIASFVITPNKPTEEKLPRISKRLIDFSSVCTHWRSIAVGCPPLWSTFHSPGPDLTRLLISRSDQCALDVKFVFRDNSIRETQRSALHCALNQLYRIRFLSINAPLEIIGEVAQRLQSVASALRYLEKLILYNPRGPAAENSSLVLFNFMPPPSLRLISVYGNSALRSTALMKSSLRAMYLSGPKFTIHQWFELLSALPALSSLRLTYPVTSTMASGEVPHPIGIVDLPALRNLYLKDDPNSITSFLSMLVLHHDMNISIVTKLKRGNPPTSLCKLLVPWIIAQEGEGPLAISLSSYRQRQYFSRISFLGNQSLMIAFETHAFLKSEEVHVYQPLVEMLSATGAEEIRVDETLGRSLFRPVLFEVVATKLPRLKTLTLVSKKPYPLLKNLFSCHNSNAWKRVLPSIDTLKLVAADLSDLEVPAFAQVLKASGTRRIILKECLGSLGDLDAEELGRYTELVSKR
jgi:hypothetical protein